MKLIFCSMILFSALFIVGNQSAEGDIAKIVSPKYELKVDENIYVIHYGYYGSLEFDIDKLQSAILPEVSSMSINEEEKSLEVLLDNVKQKQFFWVMIPFDVMSAEGDDFVLLIDGVETGYEFTKGTGDNTIGMVVPAGAKKVEIIGTSVIPEFGGIALLIFSIAIIPLLILRKNSFFQKLC